jgi:hypothetical protein
MGPQSEKGKSPQAGTATLVNCYVEKTQGGKSDYALYTDPGSILFSTISASAAFRGAIRLGDNDLYAVCGENAYNIAGTGVATLLGVVLGSLPVIFSINRKTPYNQITITTETKNYYIENNILTEITDPDLPAGVHSNAYLNGMTLYGLRSGELYWSDNNATQSIDALNFVEAERSPDKGVRVFVNGDEVWYFQAESLEIFRDTGVTGARLEPQQSLAQGKGAGCIAKNSVAIVDSTVVWISDAKVVVMGNPYSPIIISNFEVARDIERAFDAGLSDEIVAMARETQGHQWYTIRCSLWCWSWDAATQLWHRQESYLSDTWYGGFYVYTYSRHLIFSAIAGKIYEYTFDAQDEDGEPLITKIITNCASNFPSGFVCDALHVDVQSGTGRASGAAYVQDPKMILRVSHDGGMTYGREYLQSLGAQGKWRKNIRYNRLGKTNGSGMVFEIRLPDPVERSVFSAFADVRGLT